VRVRVLGIGMGPQHVTPEASEALRGCDYVLAADKARTTTIKIPPRKNVPGDGLHAIRQSVCEAHGVPLVSVPDPERDRDPAGYPAAVAAWHEARVAAYEEVLAERGGTAGFLVWGDPSLYDSTIRVVAAIARRGVVPVSYDVLPGISAPQLLAARHRIVLHPVGAPVHVTTARRLPEAITGGQRTIVVMLGDPGLAGLPELADWSVWWGANLGTPSERLIAGRVADVAEAIAAARQQARDAAGWVMDAYLLRDDTGDAE
jgi:precorrin-6A synthase